MAGVAVTIATVLFALALGIDPFVWLVGVFAFWYQFFKWAHS